jgi:hypothetical protein
MRLAPGCSIEVLFRFGIAVSTANNMKLSMLRGLMMLDAAVLLLLGAILIVAPGSLESVFHFNNLPSVVNYLIGLWGCVFVTLGFGYVIAATNPMRHLVWAQIGIARGGLEMLLGLVYLGRGVVTWQQAGFGIIVAGLMAVAYVALYPRKMTVQPAV